MLEWPYAELLDLHQKKVSQVRDHLSPYLRVRPLPLPRESLPRLALLLLPLDPPLLATVRLYLE